MRNINAHNRIDYIDTVRFIGLILVLYCHIPPFGGFFYILIYSFHMPLFFILSGLFIGTDFKKTVISGFKNLIIPYFIFNIALILCKCTIILITHNLSLENDIIKPLLGTICMTYSGFKYTIPGLASWFLIALFFSRIITSIVIKSKIKYHIIYILCILSLFYVIKKLPYTLFHFDSALLGSIFMLIGYYLKRFIITQTNEQTNYTVIIIMLTIFIPLQYYNQRIDLITSIYGRSMILCFINGTLGSLILILICKQVKFKNHFIDYIVSGAPFFITFHVYILICVADIYQNWINIETPYIINKCIITLCTTIIIFIILKSLGKHIPFLLKR